jgi:pyrroline-5-carboxylate reductase
MREALGGKLLVSILAGVTIAQMSDWVDASTTVVRAMPNTPSRVRPPRILSSPAAPEPDSLPRRSARG